MAEKLAEPLRREMRVAVRAKESRGRTNGGREILRFVQDDSWLPLQ
jgi:hypothetical protein